MSNCLLNATSPLFVHELGVSTAAINPDGTGGAPTDGVDFAWLTSLVNDGLGTGQGTLISSDQAQHRQPTWKDNILNGFPAALYPTQSDNSHNSILYAPAQTGQLDGDFSVSAYFVAKLATSGDGQYRSLWACGNPAGTNTLFQVGCFSNQWIIDANGIYMSFGATDNNWHIFTVIKQAGVSFFTGVKFYIDGVLQTPTTHGSDAVLTTNSDRLYIACRTLGDPWNNIWQGYIPCDAFYLTAHDATNQSIVETCLFNRYFGTPPGSVTGLRGLLTGGQMNLGSLRHGGAMGGL